MIGISPTYEAIVLKGVYYCTTSMTILSYHLALISLNPGSATACSGLHSSSINLTVYAWREKKIFVCMQMRQKFGACILSAK